MPTSGVSEAVAVEEQEATIIDYAAVSKELPLVSIGLAGADGAVAQDGIAQGIEETDQRRAYERAKAIHYELGDNPIAGLEERKVYFVVKRVFDIIFSIIVMVCFSWLYLLVALLIKIDDPKGPIFFKQERVGKNGVLFTIYKFRTMCADAEAKLIELQGLNEKTGPAFKITGDPRITRVGKWLRKLSLDEFPQFFNVLKGDISTVGPRPALSSEVVKYTAYQRQRLLVKPGITCYWQTRKCRDTIPFDEWIDLDLLYIKKCGIWTDFKLIVQTVGVVLTAQGN